MRVFRVLCSSKMLKQWSFAVLLLSIPLPVQGQPIHALSNRMRRSVSHAQLMHDRGRHTQDRKRQLWLHEIFEQVHTANTWETSSNVYDSRKPIAWGAPAPKAGSSTKDFILGFQIDSMSSIESLPQETNKELLLPAPTKKKKRVCLGKWKTHNRKRGWPCIL
ncbi:parathyroid hormone-like hormone b [Trichomycterus rosablanca]|uniref:parathyroid hormone-like hormone b n=1 Tax=Trichomycterus rosablanca TaxID=2290929 RepID=UPI002F354E81